MERDIAASQMQLSASAQCQLHRIILIRCLFHVGHPFRLSTIMLSSELVGSSFRQADGSAGARRRILAIPATVNASPSLCLIIIESPLADDAASTFGTDRCHVASIVFPSSESLLAPLSDASLLVQQRAAREPVRI